MPTEEKHTKRRKSRQPESRVSRKHSEHKSHDLSKEPPPEPSERPATLDDLRQARLTYLETPVEQRQKKMKHSDATKALGKAKVVEDATVKARSTVSRTKSTAKVATRAVSTKRRESTKKDDSSNNPEAEGQYVYRSSRGDSEVGEPSNSRATDDGRNPESSARSVKSTKSGRKLGERRHTAPSTTRNRVSNDAKSQSSARPPLRKSTTTLPDRTRSTARRASTATKPAPDSSVVSAPAASSKKSASIWSRVFGQPSTPSKKPKSTVSCLTCGDDVESHKAAKLPCTHRMCYPCLKRLFELSITDPGHMPPRCCTEDEISLKHVEFIFDDKFKKTYNKKLREYLTKNKIYCPRKGCGEWIKPEHIKTEEGRKVGKCSRCSNKVCGICNQKMHKSKDCPKDPTVQEFAATAEKAGWKRCYNCSAMVELKEGCNHMTCRCQAEFCMACGSKWKTCDCAWFNYEQLDAFGDPVRYQQEMDRRREQEERDGIMARRLQDDGDEVIARRLDALEDDDGDIRMPGGWDDFGAADHHLNQDFIHQAREALTANYGAGDQVARGLVANLFANQEDEGQGMDDFPRMMRHPTRRRRNTPDPAAMHQEHYHPDPAGNHVIPVIRHRYQRQRMTPQTATGSRPLTDAEREELQRSPAWRGGSPRD